MHHRSKLDKNWPALTPVQDHLIATPGSSTRHDQEECSGVFNASAWGGLMRGLPLFYAPSTAVAASAADSAIDHLSPQQGIRHDGHARTQVLSAEINCRAVGLNRFEQEDTLRDAPPKEGLPGASGNSDRVHLSESTQISAHHCDCGRHSSCPPMSAVSKAMVWPL